MAARDENVWRQRVVLSFHRGEFDFNVSERLGKSFERVLKAGDPHNVRLNIIRSERQTITPSSFFFQPNGQPVKDVALGKLHSSLYSRSFSLAQHRRKRRQ